MWQKKKCKSMSTHYLFFRTFNHRVVEVCSDYEKLEISLGHWVKIFFCQIIKCCIKKHEAMSGFFSKRPNTPGDRKHSKLPVTTSASNHFHHFLVIVFPYIFIFPSLLFPGILNVLYQSEQQSRKVQMGHHQSMLANCYWHALIELVQPFSP